MSEEKPVVIDAFPQDLESYLALRDRIATTPEGGVVMHILAAHLYSIDPELGMQAFTIALAPSNLQKHATGYKGFRPGPSARSLIERLKDMPWAPWTYVVGTRPEDGYQLPPPPYRFEVFSNPYSEQGQNLRLLVRTSGADSPRPFTVTKNDKGLWKIAEGSSLFVGMKKPGKVSDDI